MLDFEWDADKAASNLKKHRVAYEEAATIFGDPLSITAYDPDRRLLVVSHTNRGDRIRIISARQATKREQRAYENG